MERPLAADPRPIPRERELEYYVGIYSGLVPSYNFEAIAWMR